MYEFFEKNRQNLNISNIAVQTTMVFRRAHTSAKLLIPHISYCYC